MLCQGGYYEILEECWNSKEYQANHKWLEKVAVFTLVEYLVGLREEEVPMIFMTRML